MSGGELLNIRFARFALLLILLRALVSGVQAERLPIKVYTTADGLWSSSINHLIRDSRGFIWFCTRDGVSSFDGYRFVNYRVGTGGSYPQCMIETRRGSYWIALDGGGLYRYEPNSMNRKVEEEQQHTASDDARPALNAALASTETVFTMLEDREGRLWAGGNGLLLIEENNGQVTVRNVDLNLPEELERDLRIYAMGEGQDGSLWLGTTQGLMRRLPDGRVASIGVNREARSETVRVLMVDRDGRIWFGQGLPYGTKTALYVLEPEPLDRFTALTPFISRTLEAQPPRLRGGKMSLPEVGGEVTGYSLVKALDLRDRREQALLPGPPDIFGIHQTSDRRVWVGLRNSLAVFDGQSFVTYSVTQGLVEGGLTPLAEDLDGDLWIATINGPLKLSPSGIKTYDRVDGLNYPEVQSIYEDRSGALQVVSNNGVINVLSGGKFEEVRPNIPTTAAYTWSSRVAFLDRLGEWWFLTKNGLYRFDRVNRFQDLARRHPAGIYTERNGLKSRSMYCMFEDSRGDLWVSSRAGDPALNSLSKWLPNTQTFHTFSEGDGLPPSKSASTFAEDKSGNLWFGFYEGGLVRYKAGRFTAFNPEDGLREGFTTGLLVDKKGRLWITSSSGGLTTVDDPDAPHPSFVSYTTREGLSSNNARCIAEDLSGRIYVGTVRGVDRLNPETGSFKHYGVSDGLAADWVRCAYRDRRGSLWFGTFNGLSRLDPQPDGEPMAPTISISGLRIAGVKQWIPEFGSAGISGLELGAGENDVQIDFSSLSIAHSAELRYQYKLEGADDDWSAPTEQRTVNFASLSSGAYRFLVRSINPAGLTSPQPASVSFKILAPIWRRWWFLSLVTIAVASAIYTLHRRRVRQLLELERVRTRIATDLHDDIGSSLSQVSVLSEAVRRRIGPDPTLEEPLQVIAGLSRDLVDSMNDIVWAINPRRDHLSDLIQRMRRFASDVLTAAEIEFTFLAPSTQHDIKLGADVRREIFLILKESVNNAVRHSACTEAHIEFSIEDGWLKLDVHDNGKGFDPQSVNDGNGLVSMRQRATRIGGKLDIVTSSSQGTSVRLTVWAGRSGWTRL